MQKRQVPYTRVTPIRRASKVVERWVLEFGELSQNLRGLVTQKRPVYENDCHKKGIKGCRTILMPEDGRAEECTEWVTPFLGDDFKVTRFSIFVLVELAWDNAGKRTGSSNHEKPTMPTDEDDQDGHFFFNHPERGDYPCLGTRSH